MSNLVDRVVNRAKASQQMQPTSSQVAASIYQQASSREDVIKGFGKANPSMTKEQLEEAADNWEKHKNVVKDKHQASWKVDAARATTTKEKAYKEDAKGEFFVDEDEETNSYGVFGSESGFCYNTYSDKHKAEQEAEKMNKARSWLKENWKAASIETSETELQARFEEGVHSDPTENMDPADAETWKEMTEEHKDEFKAASWKTEAASPRYNPSEVKRWLKQNVHKFEDHRTGEADTTKLAEEAASVFDLYEDRVLWNIPEWVFEWATDAAVKAGMGVRMANSTVAEQELRARFEKGKPADPTTQMTEEDATKWKEMTEEHKDEFKAASWKEASSQEDIKEMGNRPYFDPEWIETEKAFKIGVGSAPSFVWADTSEEATKWLDGIIQRAQKAKKDIQSLSKKKSANWKTAP